MTTHRPLTAAALGLSLGFLAFAFRAGRSGDPTVQHVMWQPRTGEWLVLYTVGGNNAQEFRIRRVGLAGPVGGTIVVAPADGRARFNARMAANPATGDVAVVWAGAASGQTFVPRGAAPRPVGRASR